MRSVPSFSPDGKLLAAAQSVRWLSSQVWDAATGGTRGLLLQVHRRRVVRDASFSPDGKRLAACGDRGIRIWDVASRETQATWPSDSRARHVPGLQPGRQAPGDGGLEGSVELWDTATGQRVQTFKGHFGPVHAMAFSPDGARLATGGADGTLRLWDATGRRDAVSIPKDGLLAGVPKSPQLSPDGQTLLTGFRVGRRRPSGSGTPRPAEPRCGPIEFPQGRSPSRLDRRRETSVPGGRGQDRHRPGRRVRQGGPHVPDRCRDRPGLVQVLPARPQSR